MLLIYRSIYILYTLIYNDTTFGSVGCLIFVKCLIECPIFVRCLIECPIFVKCLIPGCLIPGCLISRCLTLVKCHIPGCLTLIRCYAPILIQLRISISYLVFNLKKNIFMNLYMFDIIVLVGFFLSLLLEIYL